MTKYSLDQWSSFYSALESGSQIGAAAKTAQIPHSTVSPRAAAWKKQRHRLDNGETLESLVAELHPTLVRQKTPEPQTLTADSPPTNPLNSDLAALTGVLGDLLRAVGEVSAGVQALRAQYTAQTEVLTDIRAALMRISRQETHPNNGTPPEDYLDEYDREAMRAAERDAFRGMSGSGFDYD